LHPAKRFFGAARNTSEGGSLTILATCLVDTGSRMDDLIYEELRVRQHGSTSGPPSGAAPCLSRRSIIEPSGTRHEELLLNEQTLNRSGYYGRMAAMILRFYQFRGSDGTYSGKT